MIKEAIATGATVDEAKEAACKELGIESYDAEFEILQMPVKKTLGLFGGAPAKVRVYKTVNPGEVAVEFLRKVLAAMDLPDITVACNIDEKKAEINLSGENVGALIGHRGDTLSALQYIVSLVANYVDNSYYRIMIDVGDYREKREKTLESLARGLAIKVSRSGKKTSLEPMNPYERRIIHSAVEPIKGAISHSEGENLDRHVVIEPDPDFVYSPRNNNGKGYNKNGRYGNGNNRYGKGRNPRYNSGSDYNKQAAGKKSFDRKPLNEGGDFGLYGRINAKDKTE